MQNYRDIKYLDILDSEDFSVISIKRYCCPLTLRYFGFRFLLIKFQYYIAFLIDEKCFKSEWFLKFQTGLHIFSRQGVTRGSHAVTFILVETWHSFFNWSCLLSLCHEHIRSTHIAHTHTTSANNCIYPFAYVDSFIN